MAVIYEMTQKNEKKNDSGCLSQIIQGAIIAIVTIALYRWLIL